MGEHTVSLGGPPGHACLLALGWVGGANLPPKNCWAQLARTEPPRVWASVG